MTGSNPPPLLTVRSAVIMLIGLVIGAAAGLLSAAAGSHVAIAVLVGLAATGSAIVTLDRLIAG